jgi:predicted nucleic acid-binding protein
VKLLGALSRLGNHTFWPDSISILDAALINSAKLATPGRVTDTYLLALAGANEGRLATLDRRLSAIAVEGGAAALHLIGAAA